jgi:hypothetical protein
LVALAVRRRRFRKAAFDRWSESQTSTFISGGHHRSATEESAAAWTLNPARLTNRESGDS